MFYIKSCDAKNRKKISSRTFPIGRKYMGDGGEASLQIVAYALADDAFLLIFDKENWNILEGTPDRLFEIYASYEDHICHKS